MISDLARITQAASDSHKENQQTSISQSKNEHNLCKINLRDRTIGENGGNNPSE